MCHASVSWTDVQLCLEDMHDMLAYVKWCITVKLLLIHTPASHSVYDD